MELSVQPIAFLGETECLSGEPSIVLPYSAILTLHEGSIDLSIDGRVREILLQGFLDAKDHLVGNVHHPTVAPACTVLDHLRIEEILRRNQPGIGKASSASLPSGLYPLKLRALVPEEPHEAPIIDALRLLQQFVCVLLAATNAKMTLCTGSNDSHPQESPAAEASLRKRRAPL